MFTNTVTQYIYIEIIYKTQNSLIYTIKDLFYSKKKNKAVAGCAQLTYKLHLAGFKTQRKTKTSKTL